MKINYYKDELYPYYELFEENGPNTYTFEIAFIDKDLFERYNKRKQEFLEVLNELKVIIGE